MMVMRYVFPLLENEQLHGEACVMVQGAKGFVHQEDFGLHHERLGNGHALLHTA